jgi:predicted MFS family arabinose efflux permease
MAVSPTWPAVLAAQVLFGAAFGCFTAVDLALVAQVIPSRRLAGRYLALMNFANTLPQVLAPLIAIRLTSGSAGGYQTLFAVAGAIALLGALSIQPIRRIR